jgi:hypothetical protein
MKSKNNLENYLKTFAVPENLNMKLVLGPFPTAN